MLLGPSSNNQPIQPPLLSQDILGMGFFLFCRVNQRKESLFHLTIPLEHIDFSYHRLLDIKHIIIVTYFLRENPLSSHSLLFLISSKGSFICTFHQTGHTTAFDGLVVDHSLEWKIAQIANASTIQDRSAIQEDPNLFIPMSNHLLIK